MLYIPDIIPEPDPADGLISRASMARYILQLMAEDYSQTHHFVSWDDEMPYRLWDDVHGQPQEAALGETTLSEDDRKLFRDLATVANGWWLDLHDQDGFLPMNQWQERIHNRKTP